MNHVELKKLEKKMDFGTEIEKAYLNDYLENKTVPPEYLEYCRAWERAYFRWEKLSQGTGHKNKRI